MVGAMSRAPTRPAGTSLAAPVCPTRHRDGEWPRVGPCYAAALWLCLGLLLVVLLDVLVDALGEGQVAVDVAGIWIIGIRDDREVLLALPLQDALPARRVVVSAGNLTHHRTGFLFREVLVVREVPD